MIEPVRTRTRPVPPPAPVRVRTRPAPVRRSHIAPYRIPADMTPDQAIALGIPDAGPPEEWAGWPNGSGSFRKGAKSVYYIGRTLEIEGGGYMVLRWSPSIKKHVFAGRAKDLTKAFMLL